ncbi:septin cytoskeleton organization [Homalodisca vitripennis]|nr:septin cytoskeleton organization [Homalodisca vitripennis]
MALYHAPSNQIPADFTFQLEVYSHILQDDLSIASTPRKIKKTIHSSISRTVGKKLAASLRDELNSGKIGPHFELMASARLTLDDVHDNIHTYDLKLESPEVRSHQLPLFGHFCCRIAAQPDCMGGEVAGGPLWAWGDIQPAWARLQGFNLQLWASRETWLQGQPCLQSVPVDKNTVIRSKKASKLEFEIVNESGGVEESVALRAETCEERDQWLRHLQQHIHDHKRWKGAAEKTMEIYSPGSGRQLFSRPLRQGSLYDEIPLIARGNECQFNNASVVESRFGIKV